MSPTEIKRIGLVIVPHEDLNDVALRYLVLHMNTLQRTFQFEFYPHAEGMAYLDQLGGSQPVVRSALLEKADAFAEEYRAFLTKKSSDFHTRELPPDEFLIISMARFDDRYYLTGLGRPATALALGNWQREMAPPSILEFVITLVLRYAYATLAPWLADPVHLGIKGCLFDLGARIDLHEVRYKVLTGFVCDFCRARLAADGRPELADEMSFILEMKWLGKLSDPSSPAGIVANLGFNLFRTRGVGPSRWERYRDLLEQESIRELVKLVFGIVLVVLLLVLGLSTRR